MKQEKTSGVMIGIFICLILIAIKPVPTFEYDTSDHLSVEDYESEQIIQIGENRIAIIDNHWNSGNHGNITVLEFNEDTKRFEKVSTDNYLQHIE